MPFQISFWNLAGLDILCERLRLGEGHILECVRFAPYEELEHKHPLLLRQNDGKIASARVVADVQMGAVATIATTSTDVHSEHRVCGGGGREGKQEGRVSIGAVSDGLCEPEGLAP